MAGYGSLWSPAYVPFQSQASALSCFRKDFDPPDDFKDQMQAPLPQSLCQTFLFRTVGATNCLAESS